MKVAIPAESDQGLGSTICPHFGSAPWYIVVETDNSEFEAVPNRSTQHGHGMCQPLAQLAGLGIKAVGASGMGMRALEMIREGGVEVFCTSAATVGEAVREIASGNAKPLTSTCAQGHHGHGGCGH